MTHDEPFYSESQRHDWLPFGEKQSRAEHLRVCRESVAVWCFCGKPGLLIRHLDRVVHEDLTDSRTCRPRDWSDLLSPRPWGGERRG